MTGERMEVTVAGPLVTRAIIIENVVEYLRRRGWAVEQTVHSSGHGEWFVFEASKDERQFELVNDKRQLGILATGQRKLNALRIRWAVEQIASSEGREPSAVLQDIAADASAIEEHRVAREQWRAANPVHMLYDTEGARLHTCSGCHGPATRIDTFDRYACLSCDLWLEPPCLPEDDGRSLFPSGPERPSMAVGEVGDRCDVAGRSAGAGPFRTRLDDR